MLYGVLLPFGPAATAADIVRDDRSDYLERMRPIVMRELSIPGRGEAMLAGTGWSAERLPVIGAALRIGDLLRRGLEPYRHALRLGDVVAAVAHVPPELVAELVIAGPEGYCRERLAAFAEAEVDPSILTTSQPLAGLKKVLVA